MFNVGAICGSLIFRLEGSPAKLIAYRTTGVGPNFEERIAHPKPWHDLPLAASQRVFGGGGDQTRTEAESPMPVDSVTERGLERRISDAGFSVRAGRIDCGLVDDRNLSQ